MSVLEFQNNSKVGGENMNTGLKLKIKRIKKGLKQYELAEKVGIYI